MAFAEKAKKTGNVVCVFLGDGTLGEGIVYESLNLASLWNLPVFFIVEDNRIAQTTPVSKALAGFMKERFTAFGIPVWELETSDVLEVQNATGEAYAQINENERPSCLLIHTYRFSAHSKGDDDRSTDEIRRIKELDPLKINGLRLDAEILERLEQEISTIVNNAFIHANADPFPSIQSEVLKNV
jgi:TPP-dependent pyruvate/acetoin dehydrogenase alpha subunit